MSDFTLGTSTGIPYVLATTTGAGTIRLQPDSLTMEVINVARINSPDIDKLKEEMGHIRRRVVDMEMELRQLRLANQALQKVKALRDDPLTHLRDTVLAFKIA